MTANINLKTQIRYGVISLHNVNPDFLDEFEAHYPDIEHDTDCTDQDNCNCGDELDPIAYTYDKDGLQCEYSHDSSMYILFVYLSPVIKTVNLCSPCVPNAGDLDSPNDQGFDCYGLPDDCLNTND